MNRDEIKKLKSTIYKKVDGLNDETLLQMIDEAVTAYSSSSQKDILDELTADQQQRLKESIQQADKGKTISNDQVKQKVKRMAPQIEWTFLALEDYRQIVDYLQKEWSLKVASEFITNLEDRVQNLSSFPHIGIASVKDPSTRSIIITKHNKLYYHTMAEKIEILDIFDTRQARHKNRYD